MRGNHILRTALPLLAALWSVAATAQPGRNDGFFSERPATTWEEYLVSGNGTMGLMVAGSPYDEKLVLNHTELFLPIHEPLVPPSQGNHIARMRKMMGEGDYQGAADLLVSTSHADGFGAKRQSDLFVPAFVLNLKGRDNGASGYSRGVNFNTGEVTVQWKDSQGRRFKRRSFVSRTDNVVVTEVSADGGRIDIDIDLALVKTFDAKRKAKFSLTDSFNIARHEQQATATAFSSLVWYAKPWKGGYKGYAGQVELTQSGGSAKVSDGRVLIRNARRLLIVAEVAPFKDIDEKPAERLRAHLQSVGKDYDGLLSSHRAVQTDLMQRVSLSLNADSATANLSAERLLALGGKSTPLIERLFQAARYNIISATGTNPPNLQGIWGATMTPPWAGDYTTNGNLPTAVAHCLCASTPELMLPLFNKLEAQMDYYRTNARVLFNCRGIHIPSHICLHGYDNQFDATWPMTFWTAGAAWFSMFYYDYYLHTLDEDFLRDRALPFMTEAAAFYEVFLYADSTSGQLIFCPSYSPENHPANSKSQACVNATMDIAAAKALFRDIIAASEHLGVNGDKLPLWRAMLSKMPAYGLNADGELREWTWKDLADNHQHRHASHLLGLFYRHDPEIMGNDSLREGVRRAIEKRLDYRTTSRDGGVMAFGLSQLALPACAIGDGELAGKMLAIAAESYFNDNLMTTHDPHKIFNTDMSGAFPAIVINMLAYSDIGTVALLPACPAAWGEGELKGASLRGGIHMDRLSWKGAKCTVTLTSKADQTIKISLRGGSPREVTLTAGTPTTVDF